MLFQFFLSYVLQQDTFDYVAPNIHFLSPNR